MDGVEFDLVKLLACGRTMVQDGSCTGLSRLGTKRVFWGFDRCESWRASGDFCATSAGGEYAAGLIDSKSSLSIASELRIGRSLIKALLVAE